MSIIHKKLIKGHKSVDTTMIAMAVVWQVSFAICAQGKVTVSYLNIHFEHQSWK